MKQYTVTGMSCAACSTRVEKAVSKVEGVTSCSVSLLTNSMGVEGTASASDIIKAVERAGYGAAEKNGHKAVERAGYGELSDLSGPKKKFRHKNTDELRKVKTGSESSAYDDTQDRDILSNRGETSALMRRLILSVVFLVVLMYFSMGHMMWGWPLPSFIADNHTAVGLVQFILTAAVMLINRKFFISGFKGIIHLAPNMDTLVALGSGAAFLYSTYALTAMVIAIQNGNDAMAMGYMHDFYFESAAMILTLITVGKMLEARSKGKTTDALKGLMRLAPKTAVIFSDGAETLVSVDMVEKGDIIVIRPGESIPVDGVVVYGESAVNEAALTGESVPADKAVGDMVWAATINQSGYLRAEATQVGEDTTLSKIIQMVSDAAATKAPIAKIADKVSGVFVPIVMVIAFITAIVWLFLGHPFGYALARGISVLVISCPCALGLATPVAIMVGNGVGARQGILFKTAVSLEQTGKTEIVCLDKTGTITEGEPKVTDIITGDGIGSGDLLFYANTLEQKSEHPLAKAILQYAEEKKILSVEVSGFEALPGNGLIANLSNENSETGAKLIGGSYSFISKYLTVPDEIKSLSERLAEKGKTPLFFAKDEKLLGVIAVADVIKEDSPLAVKELQRMGIRVVMLTGDNKRTAEAIGHNAGVDEVIAGVLPDEKENVIRRLQEKGMVTMVGDGINDAPALTRAQIGIAIGAGTDIAIDAADVVLMKSRLSDVPAAIRLSRQTLRNIHQNLFWAFCYNIIGIPLAAGAFIPIFHWELNPMFGAAAMSLSSFLVVTNALRLNLFKAHPDNKRIGDVSGSDVKEMVWDSTETGNSSTEIETGNQKKCENIDRKEDNKMEKTMKIEGMMCGHCEARVKKCLEALPQVKEAVVSHEQGTAVVSLNEGIDNAILKKTVEDEDYQVISIQ